jgi:dihydrofolate reductase
LLNGKPKYVVSSTLRDPAWNNTRVLTGDVVSGVAKLKQEVPGDVIVAGSFQLAHTLLEHHLVDELRLMFYPIVVGNGHRLFAATSDKIPMRLIGNRVVASDLVLLTYEPLNHVAA